MISVTRYIFLLIFILRFDDPPQGDVSLRQLQIAECKLQISNWIAWDRLMVEVNVL